MSERARFLAQRFERANDEFVAAIEPLSVAEWQTLCPEEGRTVAALARHVALAYAFEIAAFKAVAEGRPRRPPTWGQIDRTNAADGEAYAACDKAETISLLRREAAAAAAVVRNLSDEQLARSGVYIAETPEATVEWWIEQMLVGHVEHHLASIRAALAAAGSEVRR